MSEAKRFTPGEIAIAVLADPQWLHYVGTECTVVTDLKGSDPLLAELLHMDYGVTMHDGRKMYCVHRALARKKPPYPDFDTLSSWDKCTWSPTHAPACVEPNS